MNFHTQCAVTVEFRSFVDILYVSVDSNIYNKHTSTTEMLLTTNILIQISSACKQDTFQVPLLQGDTDGHLVNIFTDMNNCLQTSKIQL